MPIVNRCSLILLPHFEDARGRLVFAQDDEHVPFPIRRIFTIDGVPSGQSRGAHAHRTQHQFIMMLVGTCTISMESEDGSAEIKLDHPTKGLHVTPMVWIELKEFTPAAACLVLTSNHYDEADYIRDYAEFQRLLQLIS